MSTVSVPQECFAPEQWWSSLFEGLEPAEVRAVSRALAAAWHEGWEPTYDDVKLLTDEARGLIDGDEYLRAARRAARAKAAARRRAPLPATA